jgi:hypothetical protein
VFDREADYSLALYADGAGNIRGSVTGLARVLSCRRAAPNVVQTLDNYIDAGLLEADRPLIYEPDDWSGGETWKGTPDEWPILTIPAKHQYTEAFVPLAEYQPRAATHDVVQAKLFKNAAKASQLSLSLQKQLAEMIRLTVADTGASRRTVERAAEEMRGLTKVVEWLLIHWAYGVRWPVSEIALRLNLSEKTVRTRIASPPPDLDADYWTEERCAGLSELAWQLYQAAFRQAA